MNSKIKSLIKNFKKKIDSLRKDIFSVVVHGSSVYSEELKPHQDIDIYFILKRKDIRVYRKIKKILNDFCKENSKGDIFTYYSIAGAGNVQVEKNLQKKKQVYRLEIFFSDEKNFKICWKENSSFPKSLCKNYKILIGEDIKKYLPFVGSQENLIEIYDGFDKLQWNYVSIIESDFNSKVIYSSVQEGIFYDLGLFFSSWGIEEKRKDKMLEKLNEEFPGVYNKFKKIFIETKKVRSGGKNSISSLNYFKKYRNFNKFVKRSINEKIKNS